VEQALTSELLKDKVVLVSNRIPANFFKAAMKLVAEFNYYVLLRDELKSDEKKIELIRTNNNVIVAFTSENYALWFLTNNVLKDIKDDGQTIGKTEEKEQVDPNEPQKGTPEKPRLVQRKVRDENVKVVKMDGNALFIIFTNFYSCRFVQACCWSKRWYYYQSCARGRIFHTNGQGI
jgi:hypothetical protein